jgi:hypothetical protein
MSNLIKLVEPQTDVCLYSTESFEDAYAKALEFENLGIEVKVLSPSAPESVARMMGASSEDLDILKEILAQEVDSHEEDDSCCHSSKKC